MHFPPGLPSGLPSGLRSRPQPPLVVELLAITAAAAAATQVKTWAEGVLQPIGERLFPPTTAEKRLRGADPSGHPHDMPPQVLVEEVGTAAEGHPPSDAVRETTSEAMHWAMGVGAGVAYGLVAHRAPWTRTGRGTLFGVALWAATHGSLLPAIGIQAPLAELPRAWWVWEGGSHLVYGVATDVVLSLGDAVVARATR